MMPDTITLTEMDYFRINTLIEMKDIHAPFVSDLEDLENEVDRGRVIDFPEVPIDLITMYTRFRYLNVTENKLGEMTIVYPQHANLDENKISVTAPLGTALLGLREGDEIDWTFPSGQAKTLRVLEVLYQPEANGDFHL
ncbi:MAG: nucleoside diphosphate kinase regulator [Bacteriovoracia bacterium]